MSSERPKRLETAKPVAETPRASDVAIGPIVTSAHLAAGASASLSEVEFGLSLAAHAYHRWMVRCMAAAGVPELSPVEVLVLHRVHDRNRPKKIADLCLVLGIEDTHVVTYAIKKLVQAGLVISKRAGKEKIITATKAGADACARYHQVRERLLVKPVKSTGLQEEMLSELGGLLRSLSGHYDQAARSATAL